MSQDEVTRLVNDVMSNPTMAAEAMSLTDKAAMETFITSKGYDLTPEEMNDVWEMASKVMAGHSEPMSAAEARINKAKKSSD